jgi:hypothetical protein
LQATVEEDLPGLERAVQALNQSLATKTDPGTRSCMSRCAVGRPALDSTSCARICGATRLPTPAGGGTTPRSTVTCM